jgi:hypothetical protein
MGERIEREQLALRIAELLRLGVAADQPPGRVLYEHDDIGGIEHARDEVALLTQPRLAQQDAAAEDDRDEREAEPGGGDHARDDDERRPDVARHHRLRKRNRDRQREVADPPQVGEAGGAIRGDPAVPVAFRDLGRDVGGEEALSRDARVVAIVDHQDAVHPEQRDVMIGSRAYQAKALGQHWRVHHQGHGAGQLALAGEDRPADREGPLVGPRQLEGRADRQASIGMGAIILVERTWIETRDRHRGGLTRDHAQRAFAVAHDDALHRRQRGQAWLHPFLQARAAIGIELFGAAEPRARELQDGVDLLQLPGGLLRHRLGEAAQVGPAVGILGVIQPPARRAGADRRQSEHEGDQHHQRTASLPTLRLMGLDGPVPFRHPISVTIPRVPPSTGSRHGGRRAIQGALSVGICGELVYRELR